MLIYFGTCQETSTLCYANLISWCTRIRSVFLWNQLFWPIPVFLFKALIHWHSRISVVTFTRSTNYFKTEVSICAPSAFPGLFFFFFSEHSQLSCQLLDVSKTILMYILPVYNHINSEIWSTLSAGNQSLKRLSFCNVPNICILIASNSVFLKVSLWNEVLREERNPEEKYMGIYVYV